MKILTRIVVCVSCMLAAGQGGRSMAAPASDRLGAAIRVSPSVMEISIDRNGNGLIDYLSLSTVLSSSVGGKVVVRGTVNSANGFSVIADEIPVILSDREKHVNFDFPGVLIRRLHMTGPFTLVLSFRDAAARDTEIRTVSLRLHKSYSYRSFEPN